MRHTVVARRVLAFAGATRREIVVRFAKPLRARASGDYVCYYQITGQGVSVQRPVYGLDSVQALQCAFVVAAGDLARIERSVGARLQFGGGDHGFPGPWTPAAGSPPADG
jgi:hypothetical protein